MEWNGELFMQSREYYFGVAKQLNNKTDVERRQTLGHPRSINPNMINHVPQQLPLIF